MKWIVKFVDLDGNTIVQGKGKDWEQALDRAYTKLMKYPRECRGKVVFEFEK